MSRAAFTLVELSIVLVILGLLVGGVLSGQSLIRAAELRSVVTERDKFSVALHAFRDKYLALPGDMPNAFAFWGTDCGTDDTTPSTGCNGNGDGWIDQNLGEQVLAWEHLSRAGLIEGSFDGTGTVSGTMVYVSSSNVPKARFPTAYWSFSDGQDDTAGASLRSVQLHFGGMSTNSRYLTIVPSLTNGEAWNIDRKADDGAANTGAIRGDYNGQCFDDTTDLYSITMMGADATGNCLLHFIVR